MTGVNVYLHLSGEDEPTDTTWFPELPRNSEWIEVGDHRYYVVTDVRYRGLLPPKEGLPPYGMTAHVYAQRR